MEETQQSEGKEEKEEREENKQIVEQIEEYHPIEQIGERVWPDRIDDVRGQYEDRGFDCCYFAVSSFLSAHKQFTCCGQVCVPSNHPYHAQPYAAIKDRLPFVIADNLSMLKSDLEWQLIGFRYTVESRAKATTMDEMSVLIDEVSWMLGQVIDELIKIADGMSPATLYSIEAAVPARVQLLRYKPIPISIDWAKTTKPTESEAQPDASTAASACP